MPRIKITQIAAEKLTWDRAVALWREEDAKGRAGVTPPRVELWDTQLGGFGFIIRPPNPKTKKPLKTWQCLYRVGGKMVRETLGTMAQKPKVDDARKAAQDSMTKGRAGVNPITEKREAQAEKKRVEAETKRKTEETLGALLKTYVTERPKVNQKGRPLAPEYMAEIARALDRDVIKTDLGKRPIDELGDGKAIKALLYDMARERPSHARHLHSYLRHAAEWLVDHDRVEKNFMAGIKPPAPKKERDRALDADHDHEVRIFWLACDRIGWPFGPFFQLLLLLGPRRDELAESTWWQFDTANQIWKFGATQAKNDEALITHLPQLAVDILDKLPRIANPKKSVFCTGRRGTDKPISGFSHAAERVEKIMREIAEADGLPQIEHFTRHDLRRSLATGMAKLGVAPHVADKIINHRGGATIAGVMKVYNRYQYLPERKAALDLWAAHIEKLVGITREPIAAPPSNLVEFAAARG